MVPYAESAINGLVHSTGGQPPAPPFADSLTSTKPEPVAQGEVDPVSWTPEHLCSRSPR
jgi:hypothetical protein